MFLLISQVSLQLKAQQNSPPIQQTNDNFKYGEIIGDRDLYGNVSMQIDTGQLVNFLRLQGQRHKRGRFDTFIYESFAAAMNDISTKGWELVQVYNWSYRETGNEIRWVIRRRFKKK